MTLAPQSASWRTAVGPARACVRSSTVKRESGKVPMLTMAFLVSKNGRIWPPLSSGIHPIVKDWTRKAPMRPRFVNVPLAAALMFLATGAPAETPVERGRYLVTTIGACGNCHSPRDTAGRPIAGPELSGGFEFDDPYLGHIVA